MLGSSLVPVGVSDVCHCVLSYTFTSASNCLRTCPGTLLPRPAGIGLATSLLSLVAVEPYTTKIMFERYDLENAAAWRLRVWGEIMPCPALLTLALPGIAPPLPSCTSSFQSSPHLPRHQTRPKPFPSSAVTLVAARCRTFARVPPNRTADKIKALSKQFGKWHGISSLINLTTLIVGEWVVLCAA